MDTMTVSEPAKALVGGGQNAKYIKECTQLHLGGKGIEKIRGFEPFTNLEALWLNDNKLKKLNNLDVQVRLKALYAQNNQICTLKGSLLNFKFLETLDLSGNQLRDLEKQIKVLEKFKFITDLNLKGNPVCEEPDYRLIVVHAMPGLKVLDQHVVTPAERRKAQGAIGGDVATLTVAFGKRAPGYDPAWDERVPERSVLEQDMAKEATTIRDNQRHEAYMRERGMFMHDPHPAAPRGASLPPNAGTVRAMHTWNQQQEADATARQGTLALGSPRVARLEGALGRNGPAGSSGRGVQGDRGTPRNGSAGASPMQGRSGPGGRTTSPSESGGASGRGRSPPGAGETQEQYMTKDKLVLYSLRPGQDPLAGTATLVRPPTGTIQFEQERYEQFLTQRAAGAGSWQMNRTVVKL